MGPQEKQVLIPRWVFEKLLDLLNRLAEHRLHLTLGVDTEYDVYYMLETLRHKEEKLKLRKAYTDLVFAKNEDEKHDARIHYLCQKREVENSPYF